MNPRIACAAIAPRTLGVLPLLSGWMLLSALACDASDAPSASFAEVTVEPASLASGVCADKIALVLSDAHQLSNDTRAVRRKCPDGYCLSAANAAKTSFKALASAHVDLQFACAPSTPETCDGYDNDKDGLIDDGFDTGGLCFAGVGACMQPGVRVCTADGSASACTAQPGLPAGGETCNDVDDDCNGTVDESFPDKGSECNVGVGACMRISYKVCAAGGGGTMCPVSPGAPQAEICGNSIDDDCDGVVDNGCLVTGH